MTNNNFIEQLLDKANIVDIISRFVSLHKSGANYFGLCPFHDDKDASFCVSGKKRIWKCFGCKKAGNVITFVQQYKKISYGEAVKEVAKMVGYTDQEINGFFNKANKNYSEENLRLFTLNSDANEIFRALLFNDENNKYLKYLYDRKLSKETIDKFEIGFCGKNNERRILFDLLTNKDINPNAKWNEQDLLKTSLISIGERSLDISDYFYNRITFPIKDKNGFIVAFIARDINTDSELKYLTSRETVLFNKSNTLYNFDKVYSSRPETLVILEGNIDLMSLYEAGMDEDKYGAVALMGVALTPNHINMIRNAGFVKNIVLWFDSDKAGQASAITTGKRLLEYGFNVLVVNNITKYKDVNEILVHDGKKQVLDILTDAQKPDFLTFYINKQLVDVTSTTMTSVVSELLSLIKSYGNQLYYDRYCNLIASKTGLSIENIKSSLEKTSAARRFNSGKSFEPKKQNGPTITHPLIRNLINAYSELITMLIYDPSLSNDAYDELEYKGDEIQQVKEFVYFIKNLAVSDFDPNNTLAGIESLTDDLYSNQKISQWFYKLVKDIIANQKVSYKNANINISVSNSRCKTLISFINSYYDEFLSLQLKHQLSLESDANKKAKLQSRIAELTKRVNDFKKHKKTKYHI